MKASLGIKFNNTYHVELINSTTGKTKKECKVHNIAIQGFSTLLTLHTNTSTTGTGGGTVMDMSYYIKLGSSDTPVQKIQTDVITPLWTIKRTSIVSRTWKDPYTVSMVVMFEVPASTDYVGTVREVGLLPYDGRTCTRALLTDSEGQTIEFRKTDLDVLKVTVAIEASFVSSEEGFHIIRYPYILKRIMGFYTPTSQVTNITNVYGYYGLYRFDYDINNITDDLLQLQDVMMAPTKAVSINGGDTGTKLVYAKTRMLSTNVTSERYYTYLGIPGIGYWDLTNESAFPKYTISNIPIGVGDGSTTSFSNPLSYFVKNSDVVYKNGNPLTRGTDYTISNVSNINTLPEIAQFVLPSKVTTNGTFTQTNKVKPLLIPDLKIVYAVNSTPENVATAFNTQYPLLVEYEDATTLNHLHSAGACGINSNSSWLQLPKGTRFYIDYSVDGEEYTELSSAVTEDTTGTFTVDFPDTTAKYWRIRTSYTYPVCVPSGDNTFMFLTKRTPDIVFTTAPASGDVITMDVQMDRIMKNNNYVVDMEATLNFSF